MAERETRRRRWRGYVSSIVAGVSRFFMRVFFCAGVWREHGAARVAVTRFNRNRPTARQEPNHHAYRP